MAKKISQLEPVQSLQTDDLFLVTQSLEDATESKSISANALAHALRDMAQNHHTTLTPTWADSHRLSDGAVSSDVDIISLSSDWVDTLSAPHAGDTVIVRKPILSTDGSATFDTAYSYYDGTWRALQGNYSADNVFFDCDIKLAGDWDNIGNISKSSGTYAAKGKSIKQILSAIFYTEAAGDGG